MNEEREDNIPQEMLTNRKFSNEIYHLFIDHKELVAENFRTLTGFEVKWSPEGHPILVEGPHKLMNRKGALNIYNFIRTSVNPVTSLTDWDDERANMHLRARMDGFCRVLYLNYREWEINRAIITNLVSGMRELLDASLRMAVGGKHRQSVTENVQKIFQEFKTPSRGLFGFSKEPPPQQ